MKATPVSTRAIGRNAVRDELARIAFPRFCQDGFDTVTFDDLATTAGVSRSTFLRHFSSKEDVVLFVFNPIGDAIVDGFTSAHNDDRVWYRLRQALDPAVAFLEQKPEEGFALVHLIASTPALSTGFHEKQAHWVRRLTSCLASEELSHELPPIAQQTLPTAAMGCLTVAIGAWLDSKASLNLRVLLDQAFEALAAIGGPPSN